MLALVEGPVVLLVAVALMTGIPLSTGADRRLTVAVVLFTLDLAAMLLLGGVRLLAGRSRFLLNGATGVEAGFAGLLVLTALLAVAAGRTTAIALVVPVLAAGWTVLRLCLVRGPSVREWLRTEEHRRERARAAGLAEQREVAAVLVLAPVLALAVVAVVLAASGAPAPRAYGAGSAVSDWSGQEHASGHPISPPRRGDDLWVEEWDRVAEDCYQGDMFACDGMSATAPQGSVWWWYGWTCGGRLPSEQGSCTARYAGPWN